jgi:hypothetical protein
VAAVLSPRTLRPSRKMSPAPRKPMPDTSCAATRVGLSSPDTSDSKITKLAAPSATRVLVRRPASRLCHCRSNPIRALRPPATARLIAACAMDIVTTVSLRVGLSARPLLCSAHAAQSIPRPVHGARQRAGERRALAHGELLDLSPSGGCLRSTKWPDHVPVPSFGTRMVCTGCGITHRLRDSAAELGRAAGAAKPDRCAVALT